MIILPHQKQIIKALNSPIHFKSWEDLVRHIPNWDMYFPIIVQEENKLSRVSSREWYISDNKITCKFNLKNEREEFDYLCFINEETYANRLYKINENIH